VPLTTPIVLADGLDITLYSAVEDVWLDVEPGFVEKDYRLYDATGRRLQLVADGHGYSVRARDDAPSGADELAGLLRTWLPLVGVEVPAERRRLPDLIDLAVEHVGVWEPSVPFPFPRGLGAAYLLVVAAVFAVAVVATGEPIVIVPAAAAVAALVAAAVQVGRRRRWWPWIAAHVALTAVAAAAALIATRS
jgi:hypothetical protein